MKLLPRLIQLVAAVACAMPLAGSAQDALSDKLRAFEMTVTSAEVTALPEFIAFPVTLGEVDVKRRGCTLTIGKGPSLTSLLQVLRSANIQSSDPARRRNDTRFVIALSSSDGAVTKFLFEGIRRKADNLVHGTVDGTYAKADPSFPKALRDWAEGQLQHTPSPERLLCPKPNAGQTNSKD